MAIWIPGPLVGGISGRLGGVTFTQGAGPNSLRMAQSHHRPPAGLDSEFARRVQLIRRAQPADYPGGLALWKAIAATVSRTDRFGQVKPLTSREAFQRFQLFWYAHSTQDEFFTPSTNTRNMQFTLVAWFDLNPGQQPVLTYDTLPNSALAHISARVRFGGPGARWSPWSFMLPTTLPIGTTSHTVNITSELTDRFGTIAASTPVQFRVRAAFSVPRCFPSAWFYSQTAEW